MPPATPWHETLIYELHVKGFTMRHPEVPPELRARTRRSVCPAVMDYLKSLGVTAVELMPVHQFIADKHLEGSRLDQLLGLQFRRLFRARGALSQ